jgi:hypothetical protein
VDAAAAAQQVNGGSYGEYSRVALGTYQAVGGSLQG